MGGVGAAEGGEADAGAAATAASTAHAAIPAGFEVWFMAAQLPRFFGSLTGLEALADLLFALVTERPGLRPLEVGAGLHVDRAVRGAGPAGAGLGELRRERAGLRVLELRVEAVPGHHHHDVGGDPLGRLGRRHGALGLAGDFKVLALLVFRRGLAERVRGDDFLAPIQDLAIEPRELVGGRAAGRLATLAAAAEDQ